jgi:dTDP-glucose 4,6-dehydratase
MTQVCVIGSNSFSGASFCAYLLTHGIDVLALSRSAEPHEVFLPYRWKPAKATLKFEQLDLNQDLDRVMTLLDEHKPRLVFNFAAQSMVGESWDKPDDWMRTNVVTVARLAERLRHFDFLDRYIHVTTPEVYGSTDGWITEDAPMNPSTPYAVSRAAGDMLFKIYRETFGLPVVSTRAANVYGPGQPLYRIIPRTVLFLLSGRKLQLHGGGVSTRSFIHIDDVSEATWKIAKEAPIGETYHISTNRIISIRELVETLCQMLRVNFEQAVDIAPERLGKDGAYWLNSDKLRKLGWQDQITLEAGLSEVVEWAQRNLSQLESQPVGYVHKP